VRRNLRLAALVLGAACVAIWLALGANRGWTRTTKTETKKDPVTEIDFPVITKQFSPGVDALGVGLLFAAALAGLSFAFKTKTKH
jgi:Na+/proline symporter